VFSAPSKSPDWLWGPQSLLVSMYWSSSLGIRRRGREPNNSSVSSAEVMIFSTKVPLVLSFQQKVKSVRVSGTVMYSKKWACDSADWYSAVDEGWCLSVFGVNFLQLQVLDCLNFEGGGSNHKRELIYIYIYIYIKELSFHLIYGPRCMYIKYQPTLDTYIKICPQSASYILKSSSSLPSDIATNISYQFHISFKQPFVTQFSRHILSTVFYQSFHISAVFQNCQFCVLSVVSHANYLYVYLITNINITYFETSSQMSREVSARHANVQTPKHNGTEVMSN
jgi:hypothetical protein